MSNNKKNKGGKKEDFKFDFAQNQQQSGEGKKDGHQSVLDLTGKDAPMLAQFQKQLGALIGKSSGYLESLPKPVQERVKALKHLHNERSKLERQFEKELLELEKKYETLYQPFTNRRFEIVTGVSEPKPEELVEEKKEETKQEQPAEAKKEEGKQEVKEEKDIKGVPEFWLLALKHHEDFGAMITERDEEALRHLTDVRITAVPDSEESFTIEFRFNPNDFFENDLIKKTYVLKENEIDGEVLYDHVESTEIKWKPSKNLTIKKVTKQQKKKGGRRGGRGGKGAGPATTITVEEPTESFFHFFNPENAFQMYNGGLGEEDEEGFDEEGGLQEFLEVDYELGLELKEKVIPHAVMWYTGENAIIGEGLFDEEDDEEDDEDAPHNEDDEEEDEEFQPPKEQPGQQQNTECKQQ